MLHGHDEFACLYKFTDGLLAIEPSLDGDFHRVGNFLNLSKPVFVNQSLGHVDRRARADRSNGRLLLGVFENEPDNSVDVPYGYI